MTVYEDCANILRACLDAAEDEVAKLRADNAELRARLRFHMKQRFGVDIYDVGEFPHGL